MRKRREGKQLFVQFPGGRAQNCFVGGLRGKTEFLLRLSCQRECTGQFTKSLRG